MKYLLSIIFSFFLMTGFGQSVDNSEMIRAEVDQITNLYKLNDVQKSKLQTVLERKYSNREEIELIKETDITKYRHKLRTLHEGTEGSIALILDHTNSEQMSIYQAEKKKNRLERIAMVNELKKQNADIEDIMDARVGIFNQ